MYVQHQWWLQLMSLYTLASSLKIIEIVLACEAVASRPQLLQHMEVLLSSRPRNTVFPRFLCRKIRRCWKREQALRSARKGEQNGVCIRTVCMLRILSQSGSLIAWLFSCFLIFIPPLIPPDVDISIMIQLLWFLYIFPVLSVVTGHTVMQLLSLPFKIRALLLYAYSTWFVDNFHLVSLFRIRRRTYTRLIPALTTTQRSGDELE